MKFTLVLIVAVAVLGCALSCSDADFESFKTKFTKNYARVEENKLRKEIFCANLRKIEAHNRLYEQGLTSYKQGINQFADMTPEEFQHSGYVMHPKFGKH